MLLKTEIKILFVIFIGVLIVSISACEDPCKDIVCPPNSFCSVGLCLCESGYVKNSNGDCVLESSDFSGNWDAVENCTIGGTYSYGVTATDSSGVVLWNNLYETGETTRCELSADGNSCTVKSGQTVDGFPVSGTCTLNSDGSATFNYQLQWTSTVDSCSMTLTK